MDPASKRRFRRFLYPSRPGIYKVKVPRSIQKVGESQGTRICPGKLNKVKAGHSKMDGIFYTRLEMQKYLKTKNISPENAKLIFAYRTRMAGFTENVRSPYGPKLCPICLTHLNNQQGAFQCPIILPSLGKGKYNELFASEIPMHLLNDLRTIEKICEENQE